MSKGGSGAEKTTTTNEPWKESQPYLNQIMGQAQTLYNSGQGQDFFPGSTVVPFSNQTEMGLQALENQALGGTPLYDQQFQTAQRAMSGFNPAAGAAAGVAYGGNNPYTGQVGAASQQTNPFYSDINVAGLNQTSAGVGTLQNTAAGNNLFSPLLQAQFDQGAAGIRNQVGSVFNNGGMYGSAAHQQALQGGLSNLWTQLAAPAYQFERGQQDAAAAQLGGLQQNDFARQLQAAGMGADLASTDINRMFAGAQAQAGLYGQDRDARLSGAQTLGNIYNQGSVLGLQAASQLPGMYEYGQMPAQSLINVGQAREEMGSLYLQDAMQRFQNEQMAPYAALDRYRAAIGELPLQGLGTSTQIAPSRATGGLLGALGGASAGAGISTALDATGPIGWGVTGLGALLGMFG